ncbi:hypothetical protein JOB18_034425 [Solea senegalensis]|uniref:Uncharacterized protein n=1 Tax=Solea senegalensis TaxID=28829 RepID=A0AAV6QYW2_SOLSE|nr:hypothetical protein JOB18_034425 [Solea senegalensis]
MARTGSGSGTLLSRRNIKLDSFLKRNLERREYERIRAHEPCVVTSETVNKVYMHAVLSDERVYVTEHAPRTLTVAVSFRRVRDIELVNDLPGFLSGKDREHSQHVRIIYVTNKPADKGRDWLRRDKGVGFPRVAPPFRRNSHSPSTTLTFEGYPAESERLKSSRSASCPNSDSLSLVKIPRPPTSSATPLPPPAGVRAQVPRWSASVLSREEGEWAEREEREAELHLYAVSQSSRLYLQLQSAWNRFIIRSTLLLDPLYRRKCGSYSDSTPGKWRPALSWAWTCHLFDQLTSELLQDSNSVDRVFLLLQELKTAAHGNVSLVSLFWRSELCVFLVQTLEESLHTQSLSGVNTEDQILLRTVIVETLVVMFSETQREAVRLNTLCANNGALASRMLLAVICDPHQQSQSSEVSSEVSSEIQVLLSEYLDAACWLLFELLLLGLETSRRFSADDFLSVAWILRVLKTHPHLLSFITHQAQQVVLVLSGPQGAVLSPVQSVLLFQRCRLLLACLQHDGALTQHVRSQLREEFRYLVKPSCVKEKLSPRFPITSPTLRLVDNFLSLMRQI